MYRYIFWKTGFFNISLEPFKNESHKQKVKSVTLHEKKRICFKEIQLHFQELSVFVFVFVFKESGSTAEWQSRRMGKLQLSRGPLFPTDTHTLPVPPQSQGFTFSCPNIQTSKPGFVLGISIWMTNKHLPLIMLKTELLTSFYVPLSLSLQHLGKRNPPLISYSGQNLEGVI